MTGYTRTGRQRTDRTRRPAECVINRDQLCEALGAGNH